MIDDYGYNIDREARHIPSDPVTDAVITRFIEYEARRAFAGREEQQPITVNRLAPTDVPGIYDTEVYGQARLLEMPTYHRIMFWLMRHLTDEGFPIVVWYLPDPETPWIHRQTGTLSSRPVIRGINWDEA